MNNNKKNFSYFIILCFSLHASESLVSRAAHLAGSFWKNSAKLFLLKSFNKNKRKLVALSIIALAAFVYKASSQRMPYIQLFFARQSKIARI